MLRNSRFTFTLAVAVATALVALLYAVNHRAYLNLMTAMMLWPDPEPFKDWKVTPSALGCYARGVIVYVPNDCTTMFNYSPVWLLFPAPPSGPAWDIVFGLGLAALFAVTLAALAPPRDDAERSIRLVATLSPATWFILERGNVDILIFALLVAATVAIGRVRRLAWLGYVGVIGAGLLKFYPFFALLIALRERLPRLLLIGLLTLASLFWLFLTFAEELRVILANLPKGYLWAGEFTGASLPDWLHGKLFDAVPSLSPGVVRAAAIAVAVGVGVMLARSAERAGLRLPDDEPTRTQLVVGAAIVLLCFLLGQNFLYRGVFILLILPGFYALGRQAGSDARRVVVGGSVLMVAVLWIPLIRWTLELLGVIASPKASARPLWIIYQLSWWCVACLLAAVLVAFVLQTEIVRSMLRIAGARNRAPARLS